MRYLGLSIGWRPRLLVLASAFAIVASLLAGCSALEAVSERLGGAAGNVSINPTDAGEATFPSIAPTADAGQQTVAVRWQFEGKRVSIEVPLETAVLEGARGADKSATVPTDWADTEWEPPYYAAFESDPAQDEFYRSVIAALRKVRDNLGLDRDRYAELIVSMVQSIKYETDNQPPKFPIETVADLAGDCDDKSLLAAGILAREGYDVSLLSFDAESHMALGLATNGSVLRGTDYAMVELTVDSMVGWYNAPGAATAPGGGVIESPPLVIAVGKGETVYGAGRQVDKIRAALDAAKERADSLDGEIDRAAAKIDALETEVAALDAEMNDLKSSGKINEYNALVDDYRSLVGRYNAAIDSYNALVVEQRDVAVARYNGILGGQTDRVGVARLLGL